MGRVSQTRSASAGRARGGDIVTLIESVRQDRARGLTIFDETFVERATAGAATPPVLADVPDAAHREP